MRHGRMAWDDRELSAADVTARQARLQEAMASDGLDAVLLYTNHVRPAAVYWATGFTPYWADAILMVPREGGPLFATALSKRVGKWIGSMNPTSEILHSLKPGVIVGERLAAAGASRAGVVELDNFPGGLVDEISGAAAVTLSDATVLFDRVRNLGDAAERRLAGKANAVARAALAAIDPAAGRTGDATGPAERVARMEGAEEVYVAIAPDLASDFRLARRDGDVPLAGRFALRLSVAYNGVWIRRTETFDANTDLLARQNWFETMATSLDLGGTVDLEQDGLALPPGISLADWRLEAPAGTRPLKVVGGAAHKPTGPLPYAVVSVALTGPDGPWIATAPVGVPNAGEGATSE